MRSPIPTRAVVITLCALVLLAGCIPETRKPDVRYGPTAPTAPIASVPLLDERIAALQRVLEQESLNEEDRTMARELLTLYRDIRKDSLEAPPQYQYPEMSRKLMSQLLQLDEKYYAGEKPISPEARHVAARLAAVRKKVLDNYSRGDFQGVVDACLKLESSFGPESLTPDIGLLFALSLAKIGMLKEALAVGKKIASRMENTPDLLALRAHIAEWHAQLGQKEEAAQSYEKFLADLRGKEVLSRRTGERLASVHPPEATSEAPKAPPADTPPAPEDLGSLDRVLKKADTLAHERRFHDAKMLLVTYRITLPDGPELETLDKALKKIDLAEQEYLEGELARKKQFEQELTLARTMVEEERYEEALGQLEELEKQQPGNDEIKALQDTATEKLIQQERNKAARLYLMARNTSDPVKKEELLLSSYRKLKFLIDKYPSSPLNNRLNSNLMKVREELLKLGVDPPG